MPSCPQSVGGGEHRWPPAVHRMKQRDMSHQLIIPR